MNVYRIGIVLVLATWNIGCQNTRNYDLSPTSPFSKYTDKDVALARDFYLELEIEPKRKPDELPMVTHRYNSEIWDHEPDASELYSCSDCERRSILLAKGTVVHVGRTTFSSENQGWTQGFLRYETLFTEVDIALTAADLPKSVKTQFSYRPKLSSNRDYVQARAAPWETPLATPVEFRWPDEKYRIR